MIIGVVMLLVAVAGVTGWRWWHNRPPYPPEVLMATASLSLVDQATADAAFNPQAMQQAGAGDQIFLGRVAWAAPPKVLIALISVGPDGQVYWAQRLLN
ncbi:hypothetical protein DFJ67_1816 [Asanoa ferruginea]|uniref:Uncharacterized protein n=1 Tax=Asanoa ferruginea TaxID=53367 RepID=A0A3D9ZIX9_9ACTN|nr:hypothetical protein DFJ67_1816 [Asanoa ferruginea]